MIAGKDPALSWINRASTPPPSSMITSIVSHTAHSPQMDHTRPNQTTDTVLLRSSIINHSPNIINHPPSSIYSFCLLVSYYLLLSFITTSFSFYFLCCRRLIILDCFTVVDQHVFSRLVLALGGTVFLCFHRYPCAATGQL